MVRVRIFAQLHVALGLLEASNIGFTDGERIVIVQRALKNPDRTRNDLSVLGVGGRAIRIEGDVSRELHARFIPELVEARQASIQGSLSAARKAHQHDTIRIGARMLGQDVQRAVDV